MESPSEPISEPRTAGSEVEVPTASRTDDRDERHKHEEARTMASPTYRPPGYPDFDSLWSQPPQPLPGPDDHPFFKWIAEGAKKDPSVLATIRHAPVAPQPALPIRPLPFPQSAIQAPTVYPFVPGPTVAMEPSTPNQEERKAFLQPSSSKTTPDLSSSPTESSPASAHTATPATAVKDVQTSSEEKPDESGASPLDPVAERVAERAAEGTESAQVEEDSAQSVANGQTWRSGSKRDGWRRHQWSVDVG